MELPMFQRSQKTFFVTVLFFLLQSTQTLSQFHFFDFFCDDIIGNYTSKSTYSTNLNRLLPKLTNLASESIFKNYTVGQGVDKAYGLYLCRGDLDDQHCHDCVDAAAATALEKCPVEKGAIIWYQECLIRYSNQSIFEYEDESLASYSWSLSNVTDTKKFHKVFGNAIESVIEQAAYNVSHNGYATAEKSVTLFETVYIAGICTPDIIGNLCERCLREALSLMAGCCGTRRVGLQMYLPSCWLRYDDAPFLLESDVFPPESSPGEVGSNFGPPPPPPPPKNAGVSTMATISTMWFCSALLLLI